MEKKKALKVLMAASSSSSSSSRRREEVIGEQDSPEGIEEGRRRKRRSPSTNQKCRTLADPILNRQKPGGATVAEFRWRHPLHADVYVEPAVLHHCFCRKFVLLLT